MHKIQDWLELHDLDAAICEDILAAYRAGVIAEMPPVGALVKGSSASASADLSSFSSCLTQLVGPALEAAIGATDADDCSVARLLNAVGWEVISQSEVARPYTEDRGTDSAPVVRIPWCGRKEDLLCLAHEAAHALQIMFSHGGAMPPVARECCAFLGEIALIQHASCTAPDLACQLQSIWQAQSETYLGADFDRLATALRNPRMPYDYRMNYPLARLAAVAMAVQGTGPWLRDLFSSGPRGMARLPLAALAASAEDVTNPLPPMPEAEPDLPALEMYRTLGAMVALDIEAWNDRTATPICDYYADCLRTAENGLLIALDGDRRPFGYATWTGAEPGGVFTQLTAPFGRYGELRRRVAARGVTANEV